MRCWSCTDESFSFLHMILQRHLVLPSAQPESSACFVLVQVQMSFFGFFLAALPLLLFLNVSGEHFIYTILVSSSNMVFDFKSPGLVLVCLWKTQPSSSGISAMAPWISLKRCSWGEHVPMRLYFNASSGHLSVVLAPPSKWMICCSIFGRGASRASNAQSPTRPLLVGSHFVQSICCLDDSSPVINHTDRS